MNESRGRMTPYSLKVERTQRRIVRPQSMAKRHDQAVRPRRSYWRRISRIGTWRLR